METRRLTVELALPGGVVRVGMDVPTGEVPMGALLPALRTTADAFVDYAARMSEAAGKPIPIAIETWERWTEPSAVYPLRLVCPRRSCSEER